MTLEEKFNRIVIRHYRKYTNDCHYWFGTSAFNELEKEGIEVYDAKNSEFKEIWNWVSYLQDLAKQYWFGRWRPRNSRNKAINPWLELGHAMLKELRKKGWDIKER